jgi:hypothetical protein
MAGRASHTDRSMDHFLLREVRMTHTAVHVLGRRWPYARECKNSDCNYAQDDIYQGHR